jgi:hypothetical protein
VVTNDTTTSWCTTVLKTENATQDGEQDRQGAAVVEQERKCECDVKINNNNVAEQVILITTK